MFYLILDWQGQTTLYYEGGAEKGDPTFSTRHKNAKRIDAMTAEKVKDELYEWDLAVLIVPVPIHDLD